MSDKNLLVKILITSLLSCAGLLYQSAQLTTQYLTGKTLVQVSIGRKLNETLPAITLCFPNLFTLEKMGYYDNNNQERLKEYKRIVKMYHDEHNQENLTELARTLDYIGDQIRDGFRPNLISKNLSDTFNYTIRPFIYGDLGRINTNEHVRLSVNGFTMTDGEVKYVNLVDHIQFIKSTNDPVESYKFASPFIVGKCFTYFSFMQDYFRHFKMILGNIEIKIRFDLLWASPLYQENFFIVLHSPGDMPILSQENMIELEAGESYKTAYSQVNIERLGHGFDTNCRNYHLETDHANASTRSDCVLNCYQSKLREHFELDGIYFGNFLLREPHFNMSKTFFETFVEIPKPHQEPSHSNDELEKIKTKFIVTCSNQCQDVCQARIYPTEISKDHLNKYRGFDQNIKRSTIKIKHNGLPDVTITHQPETTFIAFVCNFGGLLGMWLGLSVWTIFYDLSQRFVRLLYRIPKQDEQDFKKFKSCDKGYFKSSKLSDSNVKGKSKFIRF